MTTASAVGTTATQDWTQAWEEALDALELDVAHAESLLTSHADPPSTFWPDAEGWTPPAGIGPLPSSLLERAKRVQARQLVVAAELTRAMDGNRRHAVLASRIETGDSGSRAAFVDERG